MMQYRSQIPLLAAFLLLLCLVSAADTSLPDLSEVLSGTTTATGTTGSTTGTATTTGTSKTTSTGTGTSSTGTITSSASTSGSTSGSTTIAGLLTGTVPTLAGVGIPTLIVPYTAAAPFMQKSSMPEGTVFISVGAVLAFLGAAVLAWRVLVAWSINRSVKRAALASIMASETKSPGGWANPFKPAGGFYHQAPGGSVLSLGDNMTKSQARGAPFRNPIPSTGSSLFFSPTASTPTNATTSIPMTGLSTPAARASTFLPAGYYASPSAQLASGAAQTTIGGSPDNARRASRANLLPGSRDGNRHSTARPNSAVHYPSGLHAQASVNSLEAVTGHEDLPGSRAPSAYLEDLFEGGVGTDRGDRDAYHR